MKKYLIAFAATLMTGAAFAADAVYEEAPVPVEVAGFTWSGLYVGVHGGYAWADLDASYDLDPSIDVSTEPDGGFGGVQIGYNWQMPSNIVLGVEAAVAYADISDTIPDEQGGPGETIDADTDFVGHFRGRLGYAMDRFLPFVTGGLAVAQTEVSSSVLGISDDKTLTGWTVGAGLEVAIDDTWSVSAEYLYTDLGDETWFEGEDFASTSDTTSNTIRVSVNAGF